MGGVSLRKESPMILLTWSFVQKSRLEATEEKTAGNPAAISLVTVLGVVLEMRVADLVPQTILRSVRATWLRVWGCCEGS